MTLPTTWQGRCRARGGFATVFPAGHPRAGLPACRHRVAGRLVYHDPLTVAERAGLAVRRVAGRAGDAAVAAANTADRGARAVLSAPREAVGQVLGVPPWAVPVLLIGGLVLVFGPRLAASLKRPRL